MTLINIAHRSLACILVTLFMQATLQASDITEMVQDPNDLCLFRVPTDPKNPLYGGYYYIVATRLDQAAYYCDRTDIAEELLSKRADPNLINQPTGLPPLTTAISQGSIKTAYLLLRNGAHADGIDARGGSPLMAAAEIGNEEMVATLLAWGVDPSRKTHPEYQGVSPLLQAARNGHDGIVKQLLSAKALCTETDINGTTALHKAAEMGHYEAVKTLLDAGANPYNADSLNMLPIDYVPKENGRLRSLLSTLKFSTPVPKSAPQRFISPSLPSVSTEKSKPKKRARRKRSGTS